MSPPQDPLRIRRRPWYHHPQSYLSPDLTLAFGPIFPGALALIAPFAPLSAALPGALLATLAALLLYRQAVDRAYDRAWRSTAGRGGYLIEDPWPEAPVVAGNLRSQLLREGNPDSNIPSIAPTPEQEHYYNLVKWPIVIPRLIRTYAVHLPWSALRALAHKLLRGSWASSISDDAVIAFVEGSSGIVFSELLEDGRTLRMALPERLPMETWDGRRIGGFEVRMDTMDRKISRCTFEGQSIIGDNDRILGIIILALTHWQHTKSHLMAEQAALEIERRGIRALAPSARFTLALHEGLMNGPQSPLGGRKNPLTATTILRDSLQASLRMELPHYLDDRKARFPFYDFLARSRVEFIHLLRKHQLEVSPEAAFNNIVVHPVDHARAHALMARHMWSMDLSRRFGSYLRSRFFALVMTGPMLNPLCTERLRDLDPEAHPFYAELYERLRAIHPRFADDALSSCSF